MSPNRRQSDRDGCGESSAPCQIHGERLAAVETKVQGLQEAMLGFGRALSIHAEKSADGQKEILEELKAAEGRLGESISGVRRRHNRLEKRVYFFAALLAGASGAATKWGGKIMEIFK